MSKRWFLLLAGLAILPMAMAQDNNKDGKADDAPAAPKMAVSKVVHVTVYPGSALVTREVEVPPGVGTCELIVNPLPSETIDSSLYSEGSEGVRILTTRYRTRPVFRDTREEVRKLEDDGRKLVLVIQKLQADMQAIEKNMAMIGKLEDFTAVTTKTASEKAALNSESIIALSKYVMESRTAKAKELVALQQEMQTNTEQMEFCTKQLKDLTAGISKIERDAVIVVDKANAAAGKVRLNYLVGSASWRPQYKLRAGKDEKEVVQLEYLAAIMQQTGEDWNGVDMTLSTAEPTLNAAPPELHTLEVAVIQRGAPNDPMNPAPGHMPTGRMAFDDQARDFRQKAQQEYLKKDATNAVKLFNDAAAAQTTWELLHSSKEELVAQSKGINRGGPEGPSVTHHIAHKLSVPSRHDEQVIEVSRVELAPEYFYKAVPVLTSHVYRQANLVNKTPFVLLPGEATMYQGTDFVGRLNMPLVAIGEQFTVGFGVDPQVQVQRQLMDKTRTTQGGNQVIKCDYRILVSSYKPEAINLQLWDRLPHAETEAVGITLNKAAPELSKDGIYQREERPNNLLRWDLKVDPTMNGEKALTVSYDFNMALDKTMSIGSLGTGTNPFKK
jgi:uncharacterized protein (TIGR02231 family)